MSLDQPTAPYDAIIIGAGVIGSSVAMHLARLGMSRVCVMDLDLEGSLSSSELNAGGVRATWFSEINVELARQSIEYLDTIADEVGYRACGYLWLYSKERFEKAVQAQKPFLNPKWPLEILDLKGIQKKVPFLDKLDGVAGATFTPRDGLVNPNLLKKHFRTEAKRLGVEFKDRHLLKALTTLENGTSTYALECESFENDLSQDEKAQTVSLALAGKSHEKSKSIHLKTKRVINCAGPWAASVAKILGYPCASQPIRRQVCIFETREVDLTPYGMIVDTSGVYFHPEAHQGLAGFATPGEQPGYNFQYDGEMFFQGLIWPALYERSTGFERLKHVTGWAGLYEVSPDESAIVGEVHHGLYEAHSFSGHGVMQSYAAGRALAEKIVTGHAKSIDLDRLSSKRFEAGKLLKESLVI